MQVLVRLSEELYMELEKISKMLGISKAEVLRLALKEYIARRRKTSMTKRMRGIVRSKKSLKELEEIYQVYRI